MTIQSKLSQRETPAGRRYEVKVTFYDCLLLSLGCVGLALWLEPLIYLSAAGHLIANIFMAPVKWLGIILGVVTLMIISIIFLAAVYGVESIYRDAPSDQVLEHIQSNFLPLIAAAIVTSGIVGTLIAHIGNTDQLREYMDKET